MLKKKSLGEEITRMLIFKLIVSIVIQITIFGCLLFLPAGTLSWWRAWLLIGIIFAGSVASAAGLFPGRKDLLRERLKLPIRKGQPLTDKIVLMLPLISFYGLIGFISLDVFRFHLIATPGVLVSSLGMFLFLAGWWIVFLALMKNCRYPLMGGTISYKKTAGVRSLHEEGSIQANPFCVVSEVLLMKRCLLVDTLLRRTVGSEQERQGIAEDRPDRGYLNAYLSIPMEEIFPLPIRTG